MNNKVNTLSLFFIIYLKGFYFNKQLKT